MLSTKNQLDRASNVFIFLFFPAKKLIFPPKVRWLAAQPAVAYIIRTSAKNGIMQAQESPRSGKIAPRYGGQRKLLSVISS